MNFELTAALDILERTPLTFRALLSGLSGAWTESNEGPGTFTPRDNLAHLVHTERTNWIPRSRAILEHGRARPFAPLDRFAHSKEAAGKSTAQLLDEFADLREQSLATLRGYHLTVADLDREGEHPAFGRVLLRELIAAWTVHDLGHLAQTSRVLAKQFREAVGPWRSYLPVVDR